MIEILLAIAIMGTVLASLFALIGFALINTSLIKQAIQANALAQEEMEAVRNFRDQTLWRTDGLGTLNVGAVYHLEIADGLSKKWRLVSGEKTTGVFTQKIIFETVYRDADGNIAVAGAEDLDTKKIIASVLWQERERINQVELITYLTNWRQ